MGNPKHSNKSGIQLPRSAGANIIGPDQHDMNFAQQQLKQGSAPAELTSEARRFINEVAPQQKAARINEKTSNEVYASMPVAIERTDLEEAANILMLLPKDIGRKRPDFSIRDYIRLALKNQIKRDKKRLATGGKIDHSRRSLSKK